MFQLLSLLFLDKFYIFILNLLVMLLLIMVQFWYGEFYKNLIYFITNINRKEKFYFY